MPVKRVLLEESPHGQYRQYMDFDQTTGEPIGIKTVYMNRPTANMTVKDKELYERGLLGNKDMKPRANVPHSVMHQALKEGWSERDWKRWINDPENRDFRITDGVV